MRNLHFVVVLCLVGGPVFAGIGEQVQRVMSPGLVVDELLVLPEAGLGRTGGLPADPQVVTVPGLAPKNPVPPIVHKVFGLATVIAGGLTGALTPGDDEGGGGYSLHHALGWTTAGLAAATLATGPWANRGQVGAGGSAAFNLHAALGIVGGALIIAAPIVATVGGGGEDAGGGHAALGMGGELLMAAAILWPILFQ